MSPLPCSPHSPTHPCLLLSNPPPLALSMCPSYMFLDGPFSVIPHYPLPSPLWLLSDCSLFQCLWLYFTLYLYKKYARYFKSTYFIFQLRTSSCQNTTWRKYKECRDWEKTSMVPITNKRLVSRIYKRSLWICGKNKPIEKRAKIHKQVFPLLWISSPFTGEEIQFAPNIRNIMNLIRNQR